MALTKEELAALRKKAEERDSFLDQLLRPGRVYELSKENA